MTEDMPTSAINPYGYTKLMMEQILTDVAASDPSWSVTNLRYFNPIGAHESGLIGGIAKRYSKQPDAIYYTSSYR